MVKLAWTLAFIVTFIYGMYFNEALRIYQQYRVEYQMNQVVGEQE